MPHLQGHLSGRRNGGTIRAGGSESRVRTLRPRWAGSTPWGHTVSEQRHPSRWPVGTWASHTAGQAELGTPPFSATAHTRVAGDTARDPSELKTDRSSSPAPQDRAEAGRGRAGRGARTHSAFLRLWYERRQGLRHVFLLASDRSGRKAASEPSIWSGFPHRACSVEQ